MTKRDKRFLKLLKNPKETSFNEIHAILSNFGYKLIRIRGSHVNYYKPNREPIRFPVHHNKVGKYYVKDIVNMIIKSQ